MKDRVPNEVRMQNGPRVVTSGFFGGPSLDAPAVEFNGLLSLGLLPSPILIEQISNVLNHLIPDLHPHALLGNGTEKSFEHQLPTIAALVARKIRGRALQLITSSERATGADDNIVQ